MKNLKVLNNEKLKDWAQEIFKKNSFRFFIYPPVLDRFGVIPVSPSSK
jgi:hypothetical protein